MASIEDRWFTTVRHPDGTTEKVKTDRWNKGQQWLLRWRDPDGKPRKLSFERKGAALQKKAEIEADTARGTYRDPKAGQITFDKFAAEWLSHRTSDPLTIEATAGRLRRYVTGKPLGNTPLAKIRPSMIQEWIKSMTLAESTKRAVFDHVSAIFSAAVDDELIGSNPCLAKSVTPPKRDPHKIVPWTHEQVANMMDSVSERYEPLVMLGAWLGLRAGESAGLSPDDIDWLRGVVTIRRQVKIVGNKRVFAPPKGGKARELSISTKLREQLAAYLAKYPARSVTLPWREPDGNDTTVSLMLTNDAGRALHSGTVTSSVWYPALAKAGIARERMNGTHALRHYYASATLANGGDLVALAAKLGHADASFTLRVYGHMMPDADDRFNAAIDIAIAEVAKRRRAA